MLYLQDMYGTLPVLADSVHALISSDDVDFFNDTYDTYDTLWSTYWMPESTSTALAPENALPPWAEM